MKNNTKATPVNDKQEQTETVEGFPIQDEVWPSRRWNKDMTEYIDLSGSDTIGEMKWEQWGETITISNFEGDTLKINPSGNYDAGIPSKEDRELAVRVVKCINEYPTLYRDNKELVDCMRLTSANLRDLAVSLGRTKEATALHDLADRLYNKTLNQSK